MSATVQSLEVYLGNWGNVRAYSVQHITYLIAAKKYSDIVAAVQSWQGAWLSKEMETQYNADEAKAKADCDALWLLIPDRDDLSKSH